MIILKDKNGTVEMFTRLNETIFVYKLFSEYENPKPALSTLGKLLSEGYTYLCETEGKIKLSDYGLTLAE